jgi:hypothetical protein
MAKVKTFSSKTSRNKLVAEWQDEQEAIDKAVNDFIEQNNIG